MGNGNHHALGATHIRMPNGLRNNKFVIIVVLLYYNCNKISRLPQLLCLSFFDFKLLVLQEDKVPIFPDVSPALISTSSISGLYNINKSEKSLFADTPSKMSFSLTIYLIFKYIKIISLYMYIHICVCVHSKVFSEEILVNHILFKIHSFLLNYIFCLQL